MAFRFITVDALLKFTCITSRLVVAPNPISLDDEVQLLSLSHNFFGYQYLELSYRKLTLTFLETKC